MARLLVTVLMLCLLGCGKDGLLNSQANQDNNVPAGKLVVTHTKVGGKKEVRILSPLRGEVWVIGEVKSIVIEGKPLDFQLYLKEGGKSHWRGVNVSPEYDRKLNVTKYNWIVGAMPGLFGSATMPLAGHYHFEIDSVRKSGQFDLVYPSWESDIEVYNACMQIEEIDGKREKELNANGYTEVYRKLWADRRAIEGYLNKVLISRCSACIEYPDIGLW